MLVTEPERRPCPIGALGALKKSQPPSNSQMDSLLDRRRYGIRPGEPGANRVSGQVGTAAVEGQGAPASAEGRHAAVGVLQVQEPDHAGHDGLARFTGRSHVSEVA